VTELRLRPVSSDDRQFLVGLYESVREPELAHVPWDGAARRAFIEHQFNAQDAHYRQHYPGATLDVIELDGEPAGRLYVHRGASDIRIMDIALAPAFRGRGIGTRLLRTLIAEAEESARKLSIHVEMNNPARTLYERLGFRVAGEHGVYVLMERPPVPNAASKSSTMTTTSTSPPTPAASPAYDSHAEPRQRVQR
jgi:ribosomal protein S18 acetylase RimI-like enzyme